MALALEILPPQYTAHPGNTLLTHSCTSTFKTCPKKYQYLYELGIRKDTDARPLRMGGAFHLGLDLRCQGQTEADAITQAVASYAEIPQWANTEELIQEWLIEREKVARLLSGYFWRWQCTDAAPLGGWDAGDGAHRPIEVVATELAFELPIRNPDTGASTPSFKLAGKIDKIVKLPDGRLAVMEHKTASDDLAPDSDYWKRLRIDQQISLYFCAARELGFAVDTVLYDVTRKPTIEPLLIPELDADGVKIVLDAQRQRVRTKDGKKWRESGDAANGYTLKSRRQTPEEYGTRLTDDIVTQPEKYFARVEIPRLDADLDEWRHELWDIQLTLRTAQRFDRFYRNTAACVNPYPCEYLGCCANGIDLKANLPSGFVRVADTHPELSTKPN